MLGNPSRCRKNPPNAPKRKTCCQRPLAGRSKPGIIFSTPANGSEFRLLGAPVAHVFPRQSEKLTTGVEMENESGNLQPLTSASAQIFSIRSGFARFRRFDSYRDEETIRRCGQDLDEVHALPALKIGERAEVRAEA